MNRGMSRACQKFYKEDGRIDYVRQPSLKQIRELEALKTRKRKNELSGRIVKIKRKKQKIYLEDEGNNYELS